MPDRAVTARDVAKLAGVAIGTVSNVLNRPEKVSPELVARVEAAMRQLGWSRNQTAQLLRGGRSTAVGVVVVELSPLTVSLLDIIDNGLSQAGFTLQVTTSGHDPDRELDRVELFEQQRVRGILLSPVQNHHLLHMDQLTKLGIPLVILGRTPDTSDLCSASGNDFTGGRLAADHLLDLGHQRLTVVGGRSTNHHVHERIKGARSAMAESASATSPGRDRPTTPRLEVISTHTYDVQAGLDAADEILRLAHDQRPSGILAINDLIAIGLERELISAGVQIPDDISIVGFDGLPLADTAPVPLTTIRHPHTVIAEQATALLLEEITARTFDTTHTHRHQRLDPELIVRNSTGTARR